MGPLFYLKVSYVTCFCYSIMLSWAESFNIVQAFDETYHDLEFLCNQEEQVVIFFSLFSEYRNSPHFFWDLARYIHCMVLLYPWFV